MKLNCHLGFVIRHSTCSPAHRGFTLVELILVLAIMTVLGLIAALGVHNAIDQAKIEATKGTMGLIDMALNAYKQDIGAFPVGSAATMLSCLTNPSNGWARASLTRWFPKMKEVKDAWDNAFVYTAAAEYDSSARGVERTAKLKDFYNSTTYQLYSFGPNMQTWLALTDVAKAADKYRMCGTEPDDIRNWKQETFYTTSPY